MFPRPFQVVFLAWNGLDINKFISKYTYAILEADSRAPHNDGMHLPTYDLLNNVSECQER